MPVNLEENRRLAAAIAYHTIHLHANMRRSHIRSQNPAGIPVNQIDEFNGRAIVSAKSFTKGEE